MLYKSSLLKLPLLLVEASLRPVEDPAFNGVVTEFLSQVSRQSNQYVHDLRLDWRIADWEVLDKYCRDLAQRHGVRLKALRAICLAEAGRDSEAKKFLDEALAEAPKDPMVLFTQANLFYRNGLRNEAFAVLRLPELAAVPAKDVLQGLICLDQGDLGCAERSFRAVLASGSSNVVAMGGLADVLIRQDRRDEAQMLIRDGLDREPLYVPLIELRDSQRVGASL